MTRAEKAAAKATTTEVREETPAAPEVIVNINAPINADAKMEVAYNVTGDRRKELVTAIGEFIRWEPVYKKAPTYAYAIGNYLVDRNGTLTGEDNPELITALAAQGFVAA
jgi:hypothetical protein